MTNIANQTSHFITISSHMNLETTGPLRHSIPAGISTSSPIQAWAFPVFPRVHWPRFPPLFKRVRGTPPDRLRGRPPEKEGGDLLSRIAAQYHRRARA